MGQARIRGTYEQRKAHPKGAAPMATPRRVNDAPYDPRMARLITADLKPGEQIRASRGSTYRKDEAGVVRRVR